MTTTPGAGTSLALHWQNDLDEYHRLADELNAAREEYMSGRHGLAASRDYTPGSAHMEYHRALATKWTAGVAFFRRWGWWPSEGE